MTDLDLRSVFQSVRAQPAPPHQLSGPAMLEAGRRIRRRRRAAMIVGSATAGIIVAAGIAFSLAGPASAPHPVPPGQPSTVSSEPAPTPTPGELSTPSPRASDSPDTSPNSTPS